MKTDRLFKFALKQTAITFLVLASIPAAGIITLILLHTLAYFLTAQIDSLMILSVVATTTVLAM